MKYIKKYIKLIVLFIPLFYLSNLSWSMAKERTVREKYEEMTYVRALKFTCLKYSGRFYTSSSNSPKMVCAEPEIAAKEKRKKIHVFIDGSLLHTVSIEAVYNQDGSVDFVKTSRWILNI